MRSSALHSISSVMTAPTNPSVRSSAMGSCKSKRAVSKSAYSSHSQASRKQRLAPIKQDLVWEKYKQKNALAAKERESRKALSSHATPSALSRRGGDLKSVYSSNS